METSVLKTIKILHFNDVYNIEEKQCEPLGGAARFITALDTFREENPLVFFSGDIFSPSQLSPIKKGKHMLPFFEHAKIDACCLGNHDLDFGKIVFEKLAEATKVPWLLSNVYEPNFESQLCKCLDHLIIEHEGVKIGLIGLAEEEWIDTLVYVGENDYEYEDFIMCAKKWVRTLREQECDLIIALTHMRMPNDKKLALKVPGLDMILGGHDHTSMAANINDVFVCKSGTDFVELSNIDVIFTHDKEVFDEHKDAYVKDKKRGYIINKQKITINSDFEPNPDMKLTVDLVFEGLNRKLSRDCGYTGVDLDCRFDVIRSKETNIGNFIADSMRHVLETDVVMINSGTLRYDGIIPKGVIKFRHIENLLPFVEEFVVLRISGEQLRLAIENGVSGFPKLEGKFPCVSGIKFKYDSSLPPHQRVQDIRINGEDLNEMKYYSLGTKSFMASGKDGYTMLRDCEVERDPEDTIDAKTSLINYLQDMVVRNLQKDEMSDHVINALNIGHNQDLEYVKADDEGNPLSHEYFKIFPKVEGRIIDLAQLHKSQ